MKSANSSRNKSKRRPRGQSGGVRFADDDEPSSPSVANEITSTTANNNGNNPPMASTGIIRRDAGSKNDEESPRTRNNNATSSDDHDDETSASSVASSTMSIEQRRQGFQDMFMTKKKKKRIERNSMERAERQNQPLVGSRDLGAWTDSDDDDDDDDYNFPAMEAVMETSREHRDESMLDHPQPSSRGNTTTTSDKDGTPSHRRTRMADSALTASALATDREDDDDDNSKQRTKTTKSITKKVGGALARVGHTMAFWTSSDDDDDDSVESQGIQTEGRAAIAKKRGSLKEQQEKLVVFIDTNQMVDYSERSMHDDEVKLAAAHEGDNNKRNEKNDKVDHPDNDIESQSDMDLDMDDDSSFVSDSEGIESLDTVDSDVAAEEAVRNGFLMAIAGILFSHIWKYTGAPLLSYGQKLFKKLRGQSDDDDDDSRNEGAADLVEDLADADDVANPMAQSHYGGFGGDGGMSGGGDFGMSNAGGGGFGGPSGPVPPGPPPGVAEMAAAASQSAASGAASGAAAGSAAAGTAAGAAGAAAATATVTQVGAAIGAAAVTAAAVSTGIPLATLSNETMFDAFVPPVCSGSQDLKQGYLELHIKGFPPSELPDKKFDLEVLFRDM